MKTKKLEKIFDYYKSKYRLSTKLDIDVSGQICNFTASSNAIFIGFAYIQRKIKDIRERSGQTDTYAINLFTLLHEINHAIDNRHRQNLLESECQELNIGKYLDDRKYHHRQSFEIRADTFAREELKRWL